MILIKTLEKLSFFILLMFFYAIILSVCNAQTSDEWVAIAEDYLNMDPPQVYNAADAYIYAGEAAIDEDDFYGARDYFNYAISYGTMINDKSIVGRAYDGLGDVAEKWGHYDEAISNYLTAALAHLDNDDYMSAGWSYIEAGSAACEKGDYENSKSYLLDAAFYFDKGNYPKNVAFSYMIIGFCAHELKLIDDTFKYLEMSAEKYGDDKDYSSAGSVYEYAGEFAKEIGDCELALEYWNKAKTNYNLAGEEYEIPSCEFEIVVESPVESAQYYQGDAILVKGKILIGDMQTIPEDSRVTLELTVPNYWVAKGEKTTYIKTDETGAFSYLPFAGWNTGEYILNIRARYWIESKNKYISASETIAFDVTAPELPSDIRSQVENIIQLYKSDPPTGIPWGPIHIDPPSGVWESMYGTYTNLHFDFTGEWEEFVCGGYQSQVMNFFNNIRFNTDPNIRRLLTGLDYGPIARGIPYLTAHHSVVLYAIGTEWHPSGTVSIGLKPYVFDPWPRQKPETYDIQNFAGGAGFVRADEPTANPEQIFSGYPITNAVICTNFSLNQTVSSTPPKSSIAVECPVDLLITDSAGNRLGIVSDTNFVEEFSAHIYRAIEENEIVGWYIGLPEGNYDLKITGKSTGTFRTQISGEIVAGQYLDYGEQPISKNETAKIKLDPDAPTPMLILPDGTQISPTIVVKVKSAEITPTDNILLANFPNPFNPNTNIKYYINEEASVKLAIYNTLGKLIKILVDEKQPAGWHASEWNGKDLHGDEAASGLYVYRIQAGTWFGTKKMILLK